MCKVSVLSDALGKSGSSLGKGVPSYKVRMFRLLTLG